MKLYLAGPMRGIPEFNFPAFMAAATMLREQGHVVFNPAEKDNERHGTDISKGNPDGSEEFASKQHGFSLRAALGMDLKFICGEAEGIALLPGWEHSKGAAAEHATAVALGLHVINLPGAAPKRSREITTEYATKVGVVVEMVRTELLKARSKYGPFRSTHEGWGVIEEEYREMATEIMINRTQLAGKEAIQVAAMAASFVVDLCEVPLPAR